MTFLSDITQLAELSYLGMFLSAFLAATILPLGSEVVLSALILSGLSPITLVTVATVGNVLGSVTNYALGFYMRNWASTDTSRLHRVKTWLKLSADDMIQAEQRFGKYGLWMLCFAWVPVIGDPLTVVAGMLRVKLVWFVVLVTLGKLLRYVAVAYVAGSAI